MVGSIETQNKRLEAVRLMKSREKRNSYTQGGNRVYFFGKPEGAEKGYSDCSSAVRAVIKKVTGVDIGYNTSAQVANRVKKGIVVDETSGNYPDESKLQPGDCLYFKGTSCHTLGVGHVEMYTGPNECWGHGSGTGPNKHNLRQYCRIRATKTRHYFMAVRFIFELGERELKNGMMGADVKELQEHLIELGYNLGVWGADGDYGSDTRGEVMRFQSEHGIHPDGIYGEGTHVALIDALDGDDTGDDPEDETGEDYDEPNDEVDAPDQTFEPETEPEIDYKNMLIVDLSKWNGRISDGQAFAKGVSFAWHRASIGLNKDECVDYNTRIMRENKVPYGCYHYLKARTVAAAVAEARVFFESANPLTPTRWAIDCEYALITRVAKKKGKAAVRAIVDAFRAELIRLGVDNGSIGVYIGHHLYKAWGLDYKSFAFVWIPRYGKNDGKLHDAPDYPCDMHQYTSVGRIPGVKDKTNDLNRITGSGRRLGWFRGEE